MKNLYPSIYWVSIILMSYCF